MTQFQQAPWPERRRFLAGVGAAAASLAVGGRAYAEDAYPSHAVTITVPYAPGGQGDVFARLLSESLGTAFKQTFIVENRAGASGTLGSSLVARAAPDGYRLLMGQTGEMVVNQFVMPKLSYDPQRDLVPVALVGDSPLVLAVPASSPYADLQALIAAAKAKPKAISYASSGTATPGHLAALAMSLAAKVEMVHVPYKGAGQAMADLLGDHVDCFFSSASAVMPHISSGKLRALAVSTTQRVAALGKVPTVAELVAPGFQFSLWGGFFAPAHTPQPIIDQLNGAINAALDDAAVRRRFDADGTVVKRNTPAEFAAFVQSEAAKYRDLVKATGVRIDG
jgi:tripartite-type tricarboxylate transporter receptor subunit TctC